MGNPVFPMENQLIFSKGIFHGMTMIQYLLTAICLNSGQTVGYVWIQCFFGFFFAGVRIQH